MKSGLKHLTERIVRWSEISIAPVQNGSSFFPGKVNPSLPELMFMASMVMLFARAVLWILTEAQVIDTVIYGLSFLVRGLPVWLSAIMMFIVQTIINFFVPSGSGQAH